MSSVKDSLRQMLAALQEERQALAAIDLDGILMSATNKSSLFNDLAGIDRDDLDEECLGMVDAARRLNEVNRQTRNLLAANVAARLSSLTGRDALYNASPASAYIGRRPL